MEGRYPTTLLGTRGVPEQQALFTTPIRSILKDQKYLSGVQSAQGKPQGILWWNHRWLKTQTAATCNFVLFSQLFQLEHLLDIPPSTEDSAAQTNPEAQREPISQPDNKGVSLIILLRSPEL